MFVVDHEKLGWDEWRPGVRSRAWATATNGARQIRIAEQILEPAPMHWHYSRRTSPSSAGVVDLPSTARQSSSDRATR